MTLPAMILGARGCISVVANEVPKEFSSLTAAALRGDWKTARAQHFRLLPLMNINFIESNPIPVKAALAMMGIIKENLRLPASLGYPLGISSVTDRSNDLGFATSIGLVKWGYLASRSEPRKFGSVISKFATVDRASKQIKDWFRSLIP